MLLLSSNLLPFSALLLLANKDLCTKLPLTPNSRFCVFTVPGSGPLRKAEPQSTACIGQRAGQALEPTYKDVYILRPKTLYRKSRAPDLQSRHPGPEKAATF